MGKHGETRGNMRQEGATWGKKRQDKETSAPHGERWVKDSSLI